MSLYFIPLGFIIRRGWASTAPNRHQWRTDIPWCTCSASSRTPPLRMHSKSKSTIVTLSAQPPHPMSQVAFAGKCVCLDKAPTCRLRRQKFPYLLRVSDAHAIFPTLSLRSTRPRTHTHKQRTHEAECKELHRNGAPNPSHSRGFACKSYFNGALLITLG